MSVTWIVALDHFLINPVLCDFGQGTSYLWTFTSPFIIGVEVDDG
jgi:hypothetical protein